MEQAQLVAATIRHECKGEVDLEQRVKKAMKAARNHWMVTDEKEQFRGAVTAAIVESEGDERDRIERSVKSLNKIGSMLQALQNGVPVDIEAMASEPKQDDLLPLTKWWHELKE